MGRISDDPKHWALKTEAWRERRVDILDRSRATPIGDYRGCLIVYLPLTHPDTAPDVRFLGDVLAITPANEVVASLVVSKVLNYHGVGGVLYADFETAPGYRRQGLMSAMMDIVEQRIGWKFAPPWIIGEGCSADATAFWRQRLAR